MSSPADPPLSSDRPEASAGRSHASRFWDRVYLALAGLFVAGVIYLAVAGSGRGLAYSLVPTTGIALLGALLARRFRFRGWTRIAIGATLFLLLIAFLATDEPMARPLLGVADLAPSWAGAEESHQLLLGLSQQDLEQLRHRSALNGMGPNMSIDPTTPDKFRNLLNGQRTQIESDWDNLTTLRAWWSQLASFDRIGDVSPGRPDDPLPSFQAIRAYSQTASMVAGLQALDGDGDAAFATLTPAIDVARKLEPSSRSLIRSMIAIVAQKQIMETAGFVLDNATVSPAAQARFAAALANGANGEQGVRQMIAVETARTAYILKDPVGAGIIFKPNSWQTTLANTAGPVIYSPNRTVNALMDWSAQMQDLAAARKTKEMTTATNKWLEEHGDLGLRNIAGSLFLRESTPGYEKIVDSYWKNQDKRDELLERLKKAEEPKAQK